MLKEEGKRDIRVIVTLVALEIDTSLKRDFELSEVNHFG